MESPLLRPVEIPHDFFLISPENSTSFFIDPLAWGLWQIADGGGVTQFCGISKQGWSFILASYLEFPTVANFSKECFSKKYVLNCQPPPSLCLDFFWNILISLPNPSSRPARHHWFKKATKTFKVAPPFNHCIFL